MDRLREDWKDKACRAENISKITHCPEEKMDLTYDYYNVTITWHGKAKLSAFEPGKGYVYDLRILQRVLKSHFF